MTNAIVYPVDHIEGSIRLPASKPHMQRSLLLAFLNTEITNIRNVTWCTETTLLFNNLISLGLEVLESRDDHITVRGVNIKNIPDNVEVNTEGSGFVFRSLLSIAALTERLLIRCNHSMYARDSVIDKDFLAFLGIGIHRSDTEHLFTTCRTERIANNISTEKSSQFLSMAMIFAPFLAQEIIQVKGPVNGEGYIELTISMLRQFGYQIEKNDHWYRIIKSTASAVDIDLPTDFTSLGYILSTLTMTKKNSTVLINNYYPGGTHNEVLLQSLFNDLGVRQQSINNTLYLASDRVHSGRKGIKTALGELPSLATLIIPAAVFSQNTCELSHLSHINNHKCQRIFVISENLRKLGINTQFEFDRSGRFDGLSIEGKPSAHGNVRLKSFHDHRVCAGNIIMSLGCEEPNIVEDVDTLDDGFPLFLNVLADIGVTTHALAK